VVVYIDEQEGSGGSASSPSFCDILSPIGEQQLLHDELAREVLHAAIQVCSAEKFNSIQTGLLIKNLRDLLQEGGWAKRRSPIDAGFDSDGEWCCYYVGWCVWLFIIISGRYPLHFPALTRSPSPKRRLLSPPGMGGWEIILPMSSAHDDEELSNYEGVGGRSESGFTTPLLRDQRSGHPQSSNKKDRYFIDRYASLRNMVTRRAQVSVVDTNVVTEHLRLALERGENAFLQLPPLSQSSLKEKVRKTMQCYQNERQRVADASNPPGVEVANRIKLVLPQLKLSADEMLHYAQGVFSAREKKNYLGSSTWLDDSEITFRNQGSVPGTVDAKNCEVVGTFLKFFGSGDDACLVPGVAVDHSNNAQAGGVLMATEDLVQGTIVGEITGIVSRKEFSNKKPPASPGVFNILTAVQTKSVGKTKKKSYTVWAIDMQTHGNYSSHFGILTGSSVDVNCGAKVVIGGDDLPHLLVYITANVVQKGRHLYLDSAIQGGQEGDESSWPLSQTALAPPGEFPVHTLLGTLEPQQPPDEDCYKWAKFISSVVDDGSLKVEFDQVLGCYGVRACIDFPAPLHDGEDVYLTHYKGRKRFSHELGNATSYAIHVDQADLSGGCKIVIDAAEFRQEEEKTRLKGTEPTPWGHWINSCHPMHESERYRKANCQMVSHDVGRKGNVEILVAQMPGVAINKGDWLLVDYHDMLNHLVPGLEPCPSGVNACSLCHPPPPASSSHSSSEKKKCAECWQSS
jgi:hypothetical protein